MSAIQGLTASAYQARVVGLLESIGRAMPGVGFLLGGVIAFVLDPRASFLVAGVGVLAVVAAMAPLLRRTDWAAETPEEPTGQIEASRAVPAANPSGPLSEHDRGQEAGPTDAESYNRCKLLGGGQLVGPLEEGLSTACVVGRR